MEVLPYFCSYNRFLPSQEEIEWRKKLVQVRKKYRTP